MKGACTSASLNRHCSKASTFNFQHPNSTYKAKLLQVSALSSGETLNAVRAGEGEREGERKAGRERERQGEREGGRKG
jgi:hypothetical protein